MAAVMTGMIGATGVMTTTGTIEAAGLIAMVGAIRRKTAATVTGRTHLARTTTGMAAGSFAMDAGSGFPDAEPKAATGPNG